jgi:hypothetical protein
MSRLVAVLATLMCFMGFTTVPAAPAAADTVNVGTPDWSVALTFPDLQWSSEACQFLPVSAVVTGSAVASWTFGGFVSRVDDEDGDGAAWYIDYDNKVSVGTGSFTFRHAVEMCPQYDGMGEYNVVGEVGVQLTGASDWSWQPYRAGFTVTGVPTTTVLDAISVTGPLATFSGRTTATPATPSTFRGCKAWVAIQVLVGAADWQEVGSDGLANDGTYVVKVPTYQLRGTQYRATVNGGICATSSSEALTLPVRLPLVTLSVAGKQSKLKVDIDPNMGAKAWVFQVQRQVGDEEWKDLKTYRTRGRSETRTINLPKGYYRVHVRARFGYAETYSDGTYLER